MEQTVIDLIERITPGLSSAFQLERIPANHGRDTWQVLPTQNGKILLRGNNPLSLASAYGYYLKYELKTDLSCCGSHLRIPGNLSQPAPYTRVVEQKCRVYMNYCTHSYSAAWWDWKRWQQEIDLMAMNGINMPLSITGTEAVWYRTLLELGFTDGEARACLCGPAYLAWQWMTNIESFAGPLPLHWIETHEKLGRQILERELAFGMTPIQQGFSGCVPLKIKEKFPDSHIQIKKQWNNIGHTAEIDPTDPLFERIGTLYLKNLRETFGSYGYYAADPFHESKPPVEGEAYLQQVGKAVSALFGKFDNQFVWVMQAWSLREQIVKAIPKEHTLILDLMGHIPTDVRFWGYPFVAGTLHNFGARMSSLHGDAPLQARNKFCLVRAVSPNVCGTGLFMEGIGQNPLFYDLALEMLTRSDAVELSAWVNEYSLRRYGKCDERLAKAVRLLVDTVYVQNSDFVERGTVIATRPALKVLGTGPCEASISTMIQRHCARCSCCCVRLNARRPAMSTTASISADSLSPTTRSISMTAQGMHIMTGTNRHLSRRRKNF